MSSDSDSGMEEVDGQGGDDCGQWHPFISFQHLNRQNILHFYMPLAGSACYTALSVHMVKPSLFRRYLYT